MGINKICSQYAISYRKNVLSFHIFTTFKRQNTVLVYGNNEVLLTHICTTRHGLMKPFQIAHLVLNSSLAGYKQGEPDGYSPILQ